MFWHRTLKWHQIMLILFFFGLVSCAHDGGGGNIDTGFGC